MLKDENILVTGGAGFIGSAFVRYVLQNERFQGKLVNLDLLTYAGSLDNLQEVSKSKQHIFVHGDVQDSALLEKLWQQFQFQTIVHFAAESHVDRSICDPLQFLKTNIFGTVQLLELVRKHPQIHFHHVSTDEVFGSVEDGGSPFTENSPYRPNSPYSASKAGSDHFVRAFANTYGISATVSYCSNNFGPYQHGEKFIPVVISHLQRKLPVPVYGKGDQIRDWLYVEDHVRAIWQILQAKLKGECFAIAGGNELRNVDLVHKIMEIYAKCAGEDAARLKKLIAHVPDRPGHDFRYALDARKITAALGWRPEKDFRARLEETILWYLQQKKKAPADPAPVCSAEA